MSYEASRTIGQRLEDGGGYDLSKGEMNPEIFRAFASELLARRTSPAVWEPFAGHTGPSRTQDFAEKAGVRLVSFDIAPCDSRVVRADSTYSGPFEDVDGVLFHPPYFGSAPLSPEKGELASCGKSEYFAALRRSAALAVGRLKPGGLVCAVGRDYRTGGERLRLDRWYLVLFEDELRTSLVDVWKSEPDVVLIFERRDKP